MTHNPVDNNDDGSVDAPVDNELVSTEEARITPAKIGIIGDVHWRDTERATDAPSKSTTKSNLDTVIDGLNSWGADVVIQLGDLIDGESVTKSDQLTWIDEATDYLENSGGSSGNGLDADVEYILGNHEYAFAEDSTHISSVYSRFGFADLSETYRVIAEKGVNIPLLNTGYGQSNRTTDTNDHEIPTEELNWLRDTVAPLTDETLPIMHTPISEGAGGNGDGSSYEDVVNQFEAQEHLADSTGLMGGIFGHSHHTEGWDRILEQTDGHGTRYLHVCDPHDLDGDSAVTPYAKVSVYPGLGRWVAESSYNRGDTPHHTAWQFGSQTGRQTMSAHEMFTSSTTLDRIQFIGGNYTEIGSGGTLTEDANHINLATGSSGTIGLQVNRDPQLMYTGRQWNDGIKGFATAIRVVNASGIDVQVLHGQGGTGEHYGFEIENQNVYATVADGSTQNKVDMGLDVTSNNTIVRLKALIVPGERAIFNVNDATYTELSNNVPSGAANSFVGKLAKVFVTETDGNNKEVEISEWRVLQGQQKPTLDLTT